MLDLLAVSGPLPGEAIEDRAAVGWVSTGWTHGRNVEQMLAEPGAPSDPALSAALESLASFAGAGSVSYAGPTAFGVS